MKRLLILAAFLASFGVAQSLPYFYCADAGSTDDYACNLTPYTPAAYVTGGFYSFKANTANTGAATVNFNSLGAKTIVKVAGGITTALATNDIRVGQYIVVQYDGTNMQMQSTLGNAATSLSPAGSATTDPQCYATATTLGVCTAPIFTQAIAANTSADGINLVNSGTASSGNQMYSPRLHFIGAGWKTNATAASQTVDWIADIRPVQGATSPSSSLVFAYQINGGGYTTGFSFLNTGGFPTLGFGDNSRSIAVTNNVLMFTANANAIMGLSDSNLTFGSGRAIGWGSAATPTNTWDTTLTRAAAGVISVNTGTAGFGHLRSASYQHIGTTYTLSTNTCSGTTLVGGATGGTFVSGTTGSCTGVVTMGNSATAPTGWKCNFGNRTSAVAASETASTTTTATFAIATVSGEVVAFTCDGF